MMQTDHKGKSVLPRRTLARIHIAKKALGLEDEDYRDILERVTGKRSAADLAYADLADLQREFRRLGWDGWLKPYDPNYRKKYDELGERDGFPTPSQLRLLDAVFNGLPNIRDPKAALRGFLKKRFGVEDIRFLDEVQFEKALHAVRQMRDRNS